MKPAAIVVGIVIATMAVIGGGWWLIWMEDNLPEGYPPPAFVVGQLVEAKINGQTGQVVSHYTLGWRGSRGRKYGVRFANPEATTDSRVLSPDRPVKVSLFSIERMRAYELRAKEAG